MSITTNETKIANSVSKDLQDLSPEILEQIALINESLNPEQRSAAETIHGPCIVTAGAGAGKTKTLINRAATMIMAGIHPAYILISTFTNKAATEIKDRLEGEIGENGQYVNAGTFHSIIFKMILKQFPDSEYLKSKKINVEELQILDDSEASTLFKQAIKELPEQDKEEIDSNEWKASTFEKEISSQRALGRDSNDYARNIIAGSKTEVFQTITAKIWASYIQKCRVVNGIDFDDILVVADKFLKAEPEAAKELSERYKYIMLDEYQDTNPVQMSIMDQIARHHKNIFVVGDEKQSIYKFRGSDISIILNFKERYPDAKQIDMVKNYRSYSEIIRHANALADAMDEKLNNGQLDSQAKVNESPQIASAKKVNQVGLVEFPDDRVEADMVAKAIVRDLKLGVKGEEIFVLYRNRNLKKELERKMVELNIPYNMVGDTSFFQKQEVRDTIALVRFIFQPWDSMAGIRVLGATSMGVSDEALKKAMSQDNVNATEFLNQKGKERLRAKKKGQDQPDLTKAATKVSPFMKVIKMIREAAEFQDSPQFLKESIAELWDIYFKPKLDKKPKGLTNSEHQDQMMLRMENVNYVLDRFMESLDAGATIDEVIEEFAFKVEHNPDNDADASKKVQFMTLHASKGLEADNVYMIGFDNVSMPGIDNEGNLPPKEELEEARRLAYVGITRAKKKCTISYGKSRVHNGQLTFVDKSPFTQEIMDRTNTKMYVVKPVSHENTY